MSHQRAKSVFLEIIEADPEHRTAMLDRLCAGDEALALRVRDLLCAHDRATAVLADPSSAPTIDSSMLAAFCTPAAAVGSRIGPYTLVRILGEGGFGTVYEARQDVPVRRTVALKLIRPGMGSRDVIARFEAERQALAVMDHPGIARVIEAGTTEAGLPYFVMEYVDGLEITEFCDQARLPIHDRVGLFEQVCHAVQHAHAKGLIHRDLKPSNILVTRVDGKPFAKVIDFGIAKVLGASSIADPKLTLPSQIVGTPLYMAPEQASQETLDIDARADVYSLGAILYELLAGVPPISPDRLSRARIAEIERIIREDDAARPSRRVHELSRQERMQVASARSIEPGRLAGEVEGDLDWIVGRAMEKSRDRRYGAPLALAADLARYMRDEPVDAGPPSVSYKLAKFARRHKIELAAALVTLAALVAFAAGSAWFAWQQHQEAARANALAAFSQQILASVDPAEARGMDTTLLQKILDSALNRVDSELAGQPRSQVAMLNAVGYAALQIGEIEQARAAFQHGVEIGVASLPADDVLTLDAQANLSAALIHLQKFSEGDALLRDVIEARTHVFGSEHAETLNAISSLAFSFDRQGRWPEARELLEKLLEIRMRRLGREHDDTLMTLNNLANALDSMGETERALGMFRQVLDVQARTIGEDHPKTLATMNNLAGASSTLGRTAEAAALYERALGIKRRVLGQNHPSLITTLVNLGVFYIEAKNFEKADAMLTEADASAKDAGAAAIVQRLGALNALARLRRMQGRKEEAIPFATSCLEIATEVFGEAHPSVVTIAANLASAELEVGRCEDALGHARRARSIAERLEPPPAAGIASADWIIGRIHAARGEAGEARAIFQQLLQIPEVLRTIRASMPADVEGALKAIEDGQASDSPCADR